MIQKFLLMLVFLLAFNVNAFAQSEMVDSYLNEAKTEVEAGNYESARYSLNQAIVMAPERADVFFQSAQLWVAMGDWQQAVGDINECIRIQPENFENYAIRAYLWQGLKNRTNAKADIDKVMQLKPDSVEAYYVRALVYESAGMYEQAIADYSKAIEVNEKLSKSKRRDSLEIFAEFAHTHICDKNGGALYFHRGMSKSKSGDLAGSKKDFKKAVKIKPELADSLPEGILQ